MSASLTDEKTQFIRIGMSKVNAQMQISQRRHDIDWLRVIAIGLLLIYHISIGFQPWGVFIGFIQNGDSLESIWIPMSMLNVWRIPLLFFVSGMGVSFAIERRDFKKLIMERSRRILLPFIFGTIAIVPIHVFLWQKYYSQDITFVLNPAHLWFLGNIFIYVVVLSPLFFYLKKNKSGAINRGLKRLLGTPLGLMAIILPFVVESILVNPDSFEIYAMTLHGFWIGMIAFFVGFSCVWSGVAFFDTVKKWKWGLIACAFTLYLTRLVYFDLKPENYLLSIESCLWIFGVFGLGYSYLNRPSRVLSYLSQAAYPVYIIHMAFLYLGSYLFFDLEMPQWIKFGLVVLLTGLGCFLSYEFVIRRLGFLRPLFGLKSKTSPPIAANPLVGALAISDNLTI